MTADSGAEPPMDIAFLIRSLEGGGAERQLVTLAKGLHGRGHRVRVLTFYGGGLFEGDLKASGCLPLSLGKGGRWDLLGFFVRLVRMLRNDRPQVLHAYMGPSNILVSLLKPWLTGVKVVWGVRGAQKDLSHYDRFTRFTYWAECRLSRFADLIIANSRAGLCHAARRGFPFDRMVVIPNGIDTARFRPDEVSRRDLRATWGVADEAPLIGIVGRMDPVKDHLGFLEAAARIAAVHPQAQFICIGGGTKARAAHLASEADRLGLSGRLRWEGPHAEMPKVYPALDLLVSSSRGEGFSNVIAEAMACGVPAVVTDVGDSAWIVEGSGWVVPPGDPGVLAAGVIEWLERREKPGHSDPSERINTQFGVESMVVRTEAALRALVGTRP